MAESTRPLPPLIPLANGGWEATSYLSSAEYTIRGLGLVPPNTVIPVIVVPGIMGTNLRAKRDPDEKTRNERLKPGAPAWRPPNGRWDGWRVSGQWEDLTPIVRQKILDGPTLEVDDRGPIQIPESNDGYVLTEQDVRTRGWGEVHAESYGTLLYMLQSRLNQTFGFDDRRKQRFVNSHWKEVMDCDPRRWGVREFQPLSEAHLESHARNYYPVYAVGYNWLEDCDISSRHLEKRIVEIIDSWRGLKRECNKVILVTHSMGGLVARACAKRIPDRIAGVIHGVMPALGAPVAYRRTVCGTERSTGAANVVPNITAARTALLLGESTQTTTPVFATSPGALQLLPNHLHPKPWLHFRVMKTTGTSVRAAYAPRNEAHQVPGTPTDYLHLPGGQTSDPYELYRDMGSWYRLIDPALADPAGKYRKVPGGVVQAIKTAIATAEQFHRSLGDYYHPNTYVFYGDDKDKPSFAQVRWVARQGPGSSAALTAANIAEARLLGRMANGYRRVLVDGKIELVFGPEAQDGRGDGTVPHYSGAGPAGKVKQVFAARGVDHQESYNNPDMLMLTLRLIVKIVQEMS